MGSVIGFILGVCCTLLFFGHWLVALCIVAGVAAVPVAFCLWLVISQANDQDNLRRA